MLWTTISTESLDQSERDEQSNRIYLKRPGYLRGWGAKTEKAWPYWVQKMEHLEGPKIQNEPIAHLGLFHLKLLLFTL